MTRAKRPRKAVRRRLEQLRAAERRRYHPLQYHLHREHRISKRTLFYIKEYGPRANVPRTIIRQSLRILLLASVVSSIGGFGLEQLKGAFLALVPLVILLPALNDMIGDFGTLIASKFSTMLYAGRVNPDWKRVPRLRKLFAQIMIVALLAGAFAVGVSLALAPLSGGAWDAAVALKVLAIALVDVVALVLILFFASIAAGFYFYAKGEDPNNFLIPLTTSVADFGNMILLAVLLRVLF